MEPTDEPSDPSSALRRLEAALAIYQQSTVSLSLDAMLDSIVEGLVEAGFRAANIVIDAKIGELKVHQEASAGVSEAPSRGRQIPVFIRGTEIGRLDVEFGAGEDPDEQSDLLEFILPTLF